MFQEGSLALQFFMNVDFEWFELGLHLETIYASMQGFFRSGKTSFVPLLINKSDEWFIPDPKKPCIQA